MRRSGRFGAAAGAVAIAIPALTAPGPAAPPSTPVAATVNLSAGETAAAVRDGRVSRRDVVERHIATIERREAQLNAFIALDFDGLRRSAAAADGAAVPRGPLDGVVVAIKDNIETGDMATTAGSNTVAATNIAGREATAVVRLRAAGAFVIGKTNMDTFARGVRTVSQVAGATRNPLDPAMAPGGSSGGSAVAVAAGMADVALGSDTCGSLRYPAAYTGLFGLRPTPGLVSRDGLVPLSPTHDVVGPIASNVGDIALVLDVIAGPDLLDPLTAGAPPTAQPGHGYGTAVAEVATVPGRTLRIGVIESLVARATPTARLEIRRFRVAASARAGVEFVSIAAMPALPPGLVINDEFEPAKASYLAARRGGETSDPWLLAPLPVRDRAGYERRRRERETVRTRLVALLDVLQLDALAYPTTPFDPAPVGRPQPSANCQFAAAGGLPALSVPVGRFVGLDLLGRPFDEALLLVAAERLVGSRR